jgi:hypothetical protein
LFGLMPDYLEIDTPSRLTAGLLNDLLLDVYPRKVTVLDRNDIASTIPALRVCDTNVGDPLLLGLAVEAASYRASRGKG